jgi:hypothetical protein
LVTHASDEQKEAMIDAAQDKVIAFLNQSPPNWELAEKHGKANLCVDAALTTL